MVGIEKVKRVALFLVAAGVFVAPLAYAQSGLFIGSSKSKSAQEEGEDSKPRLFIRPGQSKSQEKGKPFAIKNSIKDNSPLGPYADLARSGADLVMPNRDMRGNKTPTKEDLMTMIVANNKENFEIARKESALTIQSIQQFYAARDEERLLEENKDSVEQIKNLAEKIQESRDDSPQERRQTESGGSGKKQVYVGAKKNLSGSSSGKPKRIFNSYD